MKRSVDRVHADVQPGLIWNAFIDLISIEDYANLSPLQRKAHLAFWYEDEVQNGGHGQYFENRGTKQLGETVAALTDLGLSCHAGVLSRAVTALPALDPQSDWESVVEEGFIEELDKAFNACTPTIIEALEQHLAANRDEYVEIT
jgi:hypothetical protein